MYGFKATYVYALKCWFKENSAFTISISFVLWWLLCSNSIRIAEYRSNPILKSLENSLWLTFITMSTAGLGDLYPVTNIGYCLSTLAQYSGVTMLSIAVMLLRSTFELNSSKFHCNIRIKEDFDHTEKPVRKELTESCCLRIHQRVNLASVEKQEKPIARYKARAKPERA
jgi:hypothetical protein